MEPFVQKNTSSQNLVDNFRGSLGLRRATDTSGKGALRQGYRPMREEERMVTGPGQQRRRNWEMLKDNKTWG